MSVDAREVFGPTPDRRELLWRGVFGALEVMYHSAVDWIECDHFVERSFWRTGGHVPQCCRLNRVRSFCISVHNLLHCSGRDQSLHDIGSMLFALYRELHSDQYTLECHDSVLK